MSWSIRKTTEGIDAELVGTSPGSVPGCCPSSHWVTTGTSASAYSCHASGLSVRDTGTLRPAAMSNGQMRSGSTADRGTAV